MLNTGEGTRALGESVIGGLVDGIATTDNVVEHGGASCFGGIDIVIHCWRSIVSAAVIGASISGVTSNATCWKWRRRTCSQNKLDQ